MRRLAGPTQSKRAGSGAALGPLTTLETRSALLETRSALLETRSALLETRSSLLETRSALLETRSASTASKALKARKAFTALKAATALVTLTALSFSSRDALAEPSKMPTPFGFNYGEVETTRIAGLGGALRAVGNGTAGMFLNPASLAVTRMYHIEALAEGSPEMGRLMAGGAIVDSMMNRYRLAGGIAVTGGILDPDGADWSTLDVRLGLAYPISERLYIGVGGRYASTSQGSELAPPDGPGAGDVSTLKLDAFTFDAGLILKPTDKFYIGIVGQNIASTHRGTYPTTVGGGLGYATKDFSIAVDGLADLSSYESVTARLMAGGELLVGDHVPIRIGYRFDQGPKLHALTAGLGYTATEYSIEASVKRTLSDPGATSIYVGVAWFLEATSLMRAASPDIGPD